MTVRPLLSVVIPTSGRATVLPRAINSALASAGTFPVEVLVVPNGPDTSWQAVEHQFARDERVRFVPIETAHACAARNWGMENARGKYLRFLDDDDLLYAEAAASQLAMLEASGNDVCSGAIDILTTKNRVVRIWRQPEGNDPVAGVLGPSRATLTHAHLYRRLSLGQLRWDESLPMGQDIDWMMRVCVREPSWVRCDQIVGAWMQHSGPRIFRGKHPGGKALQRLAKMLLQATEDLDSRGKLTPARRTAVADGLWVCFQKGFMYEPQAWLKVAAIADQLAYGRKPPSAIYQIPFIGRIDPRVIETLLIPARLVHALARTSARKLRHER